VNIFYLRTIHKFIAILVGALRLFVFKSVRQTQPIIRLTIPAHYVINRVVFVCFYTKSIGSLFNTLRYFEAVGIVMRILSQTTKKLKRVFTLGMLLAGLMMGYASFSIQRSTFAQPVCNDFDDCGCFTTTVYCSVKCYAVGPCIVETGFCEINGDFFMCQWRYCSTVCGVNP
jgi:hypothetical protein